jgi:hypothetical protein
MAAVVSMFNSALNFAPDLQKVSERLPESAKSAISGVKSGTTYLGHAVNSKLGEKRSFKTAQGTFEVTELGPIGNSANIIKVRCAATGTDFIMKRLEMLNTSTSTVAGNPGLVSVEAMQALALRADLIPSLPENPNLVQCLSSQADNTGLCPAKVLLLEMCGESLADAVMQSGGTMKADEILHVLRDVAGGLFCLHSMEKGPVVHGSLQPDHIYRDTKSGMWKLGSFGAIHESMDDDPEDAASDMWQLGLLLLTLLFGATAFDQKSLISKMTPTEVHNTLLASITSGRPCNNVEGRILLLSMWLLAADPAKRPTAEQVVIAAGSLASMPAPQLALALPATVQKDFRTLCMALVRRTIFDAINNIEGSDRRILINKYGEEALRNPGSLPNSVKQGALSTDQSNYIRVIQSFLPAAQDKLSTDAQKLNKDLAQSAVVTRAEKVQEPIQAQEPAQVDLLDFGGETSSPPSPNANEAPKVQEKVDLMDLSSSTTEEPALTGIPSTASSPCSAEADLLGSLESLPSAPTPPAQVGKLDLFSVPTAQATQPQSLDLASLYNMPPSQPANGFGGYAAPGQAPQAPMVGMTQVSLPKKEEPKDPFAGLAGF